MKRLKRFVRVAALTALLTALVSGSVLIGVKAAPEIEAAKTAKTSVAAMRHEVDRQASRSAVDGGWRHQIDFEHLIEEVRGYQGGDYTLSVEGGVTTVTAVKTVEYTMCGYSYVEHHTWSANDRDMTVVHSCTTTRV